MDRDDPHCSAQKKFFAGNRTRDDHKRPFVDPVCPVMAAIAVDWPGTAHDHRVLGEFILLGECALVAGGLIDTLSRAGPESFLKGTILNNIAESSSEFNSQLEP